MQQHSGRPSGEKHNATYLSCRGAHLLAQSIYCNSVSLLGSLRSLLFFVHPQLSTLACQECLNGACLTGWLAAEVSVTLESMRRLFR